MMGDKVISYWDDSGGVQGNAKPRLDGTITYIRGRVMPLAGWSVLASCLVFYS